MVSAFGTAYVGDAVMRRVIASGRPSKIEHRFSSHSRIINALSKQDEELR